MTPAGARLYEMLKRRSASQKSGEGWVEKWDLIDDWGHRVPIHLLHNAGFRCFAKLEEEGLIEEHPEHQDLVRPKGWPDAA